MKKLAKLLLLLLFVMVSLVACTKNKLSDKFDEEALLTQAKKTVAIINTRDYDSVINLLEESIRSQITAEQLEQAWDDQLYAAGRFVSFQNTALTSQVDPKTQAEYATVVIQVKYEKSILIFTLSYDEQLALVGLYMK